MTEMDKQTYKETENKARENAAESPHIEIPLFERRKGKEFHASGRWHVMKNEKRLIEIFGGMFFFGVFLGIMMILIYPGTLAYAVLGIGILGAAGSFISLFAIVLHKHNQAPMEAHYYDIDYKYNAINGQETDHTREISKEEFLGKSEPDLDGKDT